MIKLLAVNKERTLIGLSEDDFINSEITHKIYNNSPIYTSLMPVSEHFDLGAIISDGFYILQLSEEYHYLLKDVEWGKEQILL